jgi:predicted phage terminase large subunit-like protein
MSQTVPPLSSAYSPEWVRSLPQRERQQLYQALTPRLTRYHRTQPTLPQTAFLLLDQTEALYGGAAGGGKSEALLMAALQYVDVPGYAAILFRKRFTDLMLEGALIPRSHEYLQGTDARWNANEKRWTFPSGATLSFGYLEHEDDKYRYQGAEFQFVGFDELTQFTATQYTYLLSRLRRRAGSLVPVRCRATANPGGKGHEWVRDRFLTRGKAEGRPFVPARLEDNPHLDRAAYELQLSELDPVTREQLRNGNWDVRPAGGYFRREWFEIVDAPPPGLRWVRYWDCAATEPSPTNPDPDWTVGCKMGRASDGCVYVSDVRRVRQGPGKVEQLVRHTAGMDSSSTAVWMEQEPGSSGVSQISRYAREVLMGYDFHGDKVTGNKVERAKPLSAAASHRLVKLVRGDWNGPFLEELEAFPEAGHDDQVDAASGAFEKLSRRSIVLL